MRYLLAGLALIGVLLLGCLDAADNRTAVRKQAKTTAAKALAAKAPEPRTLIINGNQLVVIGVPSQDGSAVEVQRCYIWRDAEYKTSTISCPSEQETMPFSVLGESEKSGY